MLIASSLFAEFSVRLEYHLDPAVVLFPDLLFHRRLLDSVSVADSEILIVTFLFWILVDGVDVVIDVTGVI